jgi:hypothetical protein
MESTNTTPAAPFQTTDRNLYGAVETNGLVNGADYHGEVDYSRQYSLAEVAEAGGKISRVRLLTERGRADVSYIHATLPDGHTVPVRVEIGNLIPMNEIKGQMIRWAKEQHVFAKGLGLLDEGNWSVLR